MLFSRALRSPRVATLLASVALASAAAFSTESCVVGDLGDPNQGKAKSPVCNGTPSPGPAPLRRLTQTEYDNTVRDLLGDTTAPAKAFPPDQKIGAFSNTATALTVSPLLAQGYESAAESLAATAVANMKTLLPCNPTTGEDACAQQFIATFGKKAFRRPLTDDEKSVLFGLYQTNKSGADFTNGIQAVLEAILQSGPFLYRPEYGDVTKANAGVVPLTSYEMASRLSYLLWGSMPDDELMAAADSDQLTSTDQIAAEARRMIQDPKARPAIEQFYAEWLDVSTLDGVAKDPKTYPDFTPSLRTAMQEETREFVDWVMWQSDGRLETLLTSPVTFVNGELAHAYGVSGVTGSTFQQVSLDPSQRAGILTEVAVMTALGKPDRSSPVLRGKFVREHMLCQTILPPPSNVVIVPPTVTPGVSTRQAFSEHSTDPACKGCHSLMDPIGFGFENFDGIGEYRTTDQGIPVDATGNMTSSDINGPFNGAVDLAHKLATSGAASDCMATEWFRYAFGRGDTLADACSLDTATKAFDANNHDMRELLIALTQTDAFRYRVQVAQ